MRSEVNSITSPVSMSIRWSWCFWSACSKRAGTVAEGVALDRAGFLERLHRAVDGRERDAAVRAVRALDDRGGVGMALGAEQDLEDDAARLGDAQTGVAQHRLVIRSRSSPLFMASSTLALLVRHLQPTFLRTIIICIDTAARATCSADNRRRRDSESYWPLCCPSAGAPAAAERLQVMTTLTMIADMAPTWPARPPTCAR
jgi:hypothetical protein